MSWKGLPLRFLILLFVLSVQISNGLADYNNSSHFLHRAERSEGSSRNRRQIQISKCGESASLAAGASTIILSDNDGLQERCKWTIEGPVGSTLGITCPNFFLNPKGCSKERLIVKEKGFRRSKFCGTGNPVQFVSNGNSIRIMYKRKELRRRECSGGFLCKVFVN